MSGHREDPLLGRQLGNYRLVERIGDGAYGEVYRAEHVSLGSSSAVKVLHPSFMHQEVALKRFWREAQTTRRLKHENIVSVSDFDVDATVGPYLVMELLEGETLGTYMKRKGPLSLSRVREIVGPLCWALGEAHRAGVIHRDLKPDNVFLSTREQREIVKILDFGIARLTEGGEALTGVGQTLGTPEYMSPEQCRGLPLTSQSDIYCLGILLFQMLSGKLPFEGEDSHQIMVHHLIAPVPKLDSSFSVGLRDFVAQMMAKSAEDRPLDMEGVWEGLQPWLPASVPALPSLDPVKATAEEIPKVSDDLTRAEIMGVGPGDLEMAGIDPAAVSVEVELVSIADVGSHENPATSEEPALMMLDDETLPPTPTKDVAADDEPEVILLTNKKDDATPTMVMDAAPGPEEGEAQEHGDTSDSSLSERPFAGKAEDTDAMLARFTGAEQGVAPIEDLGTFEHGLLASLHSEGELPLSPPDDETLLRGWSEAAEEREEDAILDIRRWITLIITVPNRMTFVSVFRAQLRSGQLFLPTEEPLGEGESFHFRFEDPAGTLCAEGTAEVLSVVWPGEKPRPGISLAIRSCTLP